MAEPQGRRADIASGAVLAGLGIYIILESRHWSYTSPDGPGPGMFPMWYGIAMLLLSLVLMVSAAMRTLQSSKSAGKPVNRREIGNAMGAWAAFSLCIGLLKPLGFVLSFGLLTFFIAAFSYRRPLRTALAAAVGLSLIFYLLFPVALDVQLPVGFLGF